MLTRLQGVFERVRLAAEVREAAAAEIRRRLRGASLPLADGRRMRLLFIADRDFSATRLRWSIGIGVRPTRERSLGYPGAKPAR
ncbi:MAG: hypothetical protein JRG95_19600 [Deltaproteobacteria bacterium]|nr:hypothetical protein [Deltaproteobacteria bacterium]